MTASRVVSAGILFAGVLRLLRAISEKDALVRGFDSIQAIQVTFS